MIDAIKNIPGIEALIPAIVLLAINIILKGLTSFSMSRKISLIKSLQDIQSGHDYSVEMLALINQRIETLLQLEKHNKIVIKIVKNLSIILVLILSGIISYLGYTNFVPPPFNGSQEYAFGIKSEDFFSFLITSILWVYYHAIFAILPAVGIVISIPTIRSFKKPVNKGKTLEVIKVYKYKKRNSIDLMRKRTLKNNLKKLEPLIRVIILLILILAFSSVDLGYYLNEILLVTIPPYNAWINDFYINEYFALIALGLSSGLWVFLLFTGNYLDYLRKITKEK